MEEEEELPTDDGIRRGIRLIRVERPHQVARRRHYTSARLLTHISIENVWQLLESQQG